MNDGHKHTLSSLDAHPDAHEPLSPQGRARRDEMLGPLEAAVRTRGRRRLAARSSLAACGLVLVLGAVVLVTKPSTPTAPTAPTSLDTPRAELPLAVATDESSDATPDAPHTPAPRLVAYVVNDPGIVARWAPTPRPSRVEMLDDAGLLAQLRAAGLPAGIIRRDDTLTLAFHNAPLPGAIVPRGQGQSDSQ